ncbi:MAG: hypothetical protein WCK09_13350 [Bacteroidota bacterium]
MAYKIIWEEKGILVTFSDTVTEQEVKAVNDIIYGDKRFDAITYQIADYSGASNILISPKDAKIIGILDRTSSIWNPRRVRNVVVTKNLQFIPIAEIYLREFEGTPWEGRIFETLEQAYEWIKAD